MNRTPDIAVRRRLRAEVGFGCPIPGCGIPYLTWHHFDPEWRVEEHQRPEGMIALCLTHAGHADANAYDKEFLRSLKVAGRPNADDVRGKLEWMRRDVLALVGGNWYYKSPIALQIGSTNAISFSRDDNGYLLLNMRMPSLSGAPRLRVEENYFTVGRDHVVDVECAARGRLIQIQYPNHDQLRLRFRDVLDESHLRERYGDLVGGPVSDLVTFPLTVLEIRERTDNTYALDFGPRSTAFGTNTMTRCWSINNGVGVRVEVSPILEALLFSEGRAPRAPDQVYYVGTCTCRRTAVAVRYRDHALAADGLPPNVTQPCPACRRPVMFAQVTR